MTETRKTSKGVMFEPDVLKFVDALAESGQRDRSFIVNQIIRAYARAQSRPEEGTPPAPPAGLAARPEPAIKY